MTEIRFAALGLDHRHIYGMVAGMIGAGCEFSGYWTEGEPQTMAGFLKRFPDVSRAQNVQHLLDSSSIQLVLVATPPAQRAALSIRAMQHGKDVMLDKPGCLTVSELEEIKACIADTGRIWSVDFSERFEVSAVTFADQLLAENKIGEVVQTLSVGPHRLNAETRPDWFWDPKLYGGILGDIGTHQIDQFLHFTGSSDAEIVYAAVGNFANPDRPLFQDFGEINLVSGDKCGYARLDWYTPNAAPNWGDGRLIILGTKGYIELRKYMDIAGEIGTDHVFLVNDNECARFDASDAGTPYFAWLADDIRNRTEKACSQAHTLKVMELAIKAQELAEHRGGLAHAQAPAI